MLSCLGPGHFLALAHSYLIREEWLFYDEHRFGNGHTKDDTRLQVTCCAWCGCMLFAAACTLFISIVTQIWIGRMVVTLRMETERRCRLDGWLAVREGGVPVCTESHHDVVLPGADMSALLCASLARAEGSIRDAVSGWTQASPLQASCIGVLLVLC